MADGVVVTYFEMTEGVYLFRFLSAAADTAETLVNLAADELKFTDEDRLNCGGLRYTLLVLSLPLR